jgi:NADH-quinone oxidoreductase subunit H
MLCAFIGWLFIPFNDLGSLITINLPIMFLLAVSSIGVYGIIFAGWASNSQYPFLGSLRSTAQMISYELVMGIVILCICLLSESFSLVDIVEAQRDIWFFFVQSPIFFIFLFAAVAETNRPPLDEAEAESEIVSGYNTDFGAVGFTIFFISEYSNVILMSAMMVVLFFGGWLPPMFLSSFSTPLWCSFWFSIKTICVMSLFVWARASFPRLRYDQLMTLTWKRLLPLALSCLVAVAIAVWITR